MKSLIPFLVVLACLFSFSSFAVDEGIRLQWNCDVRNRGDMPKKKNITVTVENGRVVYRPDIFSMPFRPANIFRIVKPRTNAEIPNCLRNFTQQLNYAINLHQRDCTDRTNPLCREELEGHLKAEIRRSKFYQKYRTDLSAVESDLGPALPESTPSPRPTRVLIRNTGSKSSSFGPATADTAQASFSSGPRTVRLERGRNTDNSAMSSDATERRIQDYILDNHEALAVEYPDYRRRCTGNSAINEGTPWCRGKKTRFDRMLGQLNELFDALPDGTINRSLSLIGTGDALSCLLPQTSGVASIEDLIRTINRRTDCESLEPGDEKLVPGGAHFLRRPDGNYEATLNINFVPLAGVEMTGEQMHAKVRDCMATANPFFKASDGRSNLNILIKSPAEVARDSRPGSTPTVRTISIVPETHFGTSGVSGNTAEFRPSFDCPGMIHEFLHHLGLHDEYHESRDGSQPGQLHPVTGRSYQIENGCRLTPTYPSVMDASFRAYNSARPNKRVCECRPTDASCRNTLLGSAPEDARIRQYMATQSPGEVFGLFTTSHCTVTDVPDSAPMNEPDRGINIQEAGQGMVRLEWRSIGYSGNKMKAFRKQVNCQCPAGNENCIRKLATGVIDLRKNTPSYDCNPVMQVAAGVDASAYPDATQVVDGRLVQYSPPTIPSMIAPNQFDRIIRGACPDGGSGTYNYCREFANIPKDSAKCLSMRPGLTANQCLGVNE